MRLVALLATPALALSLLALPTVASAAKSKLLPNATVKSLSATSLTVTSGGKDTTFVVDPKTTRIVGKGLGTKAAEKGKGGKITIAEALKEGDRVTVTYQDVAGALQASKIELALKAK